VAAHLVRNSGALPVPVDPVEESEVLKTYPATVGYWGCGNKGYGAGRALTDIGNSGRQTEAKGELQEAEARRRFTTAGSAQVVLTDGPRVRLWWQLCTPRWRKPVLLPTYLGMVMA